MFSLFVFVLTCLLYAADVQAAGRRFMRTRTVSRTVSRTSAHTVDPARVVASPVDAAPVYECEQALLDAVNQERRRYGLVPLVLDRVIHLCAREHCAWMARGNGMVHANSPFAENIAMGQSTAQEVLRSWLSSSGHRANILNPRHRTIGIAGYRNAQGQVFWCQQFSQTTWEKPESEK
jgi:uncharacterized protein YkwD